MTMDDLYNELNARREEIKKLDLECNSLRYQLQQVNDKLRHLTAMVSHAIKMLQEEVGPWSS